VYIKLIITNYTVTGTVTESYLFGYRTRVACYSRWRFGVNGLVL